MQDLFNDRHDLARKCFLKQFLGNNFYMLPKDSVKLFGAGKAVLLAYLFDLAKYADYNNQSDFFATREKIGKDLGFSERVTDDYFKFFREQGILESYRKGTDPRKWYKINANKIFDYALKVGFFDKSPSAESAVTTTSKKCGCPSAESAVTIYNNKELNHNKENITKADLKKEDSKRSKKLSLIAYAISLYDNDSNLAFGKDKWLDWITYKLQRTPKITEMAVKLNFKKLKEFGSNAELAIEHSIASVYQGLFLPNDIKKQSYVATKGNAGESLFSDNPDDYINPNTPGVKSVNGAVYEVDMFELLGRKD